ncbi:MAG TPA: hypothetical protein VNS63_05375 [Blastocatellia bacterium]|nr:hypothetical protein [Blastocatellia bacterium]
MTRTVQVRECILIDRLESGVRPFQTGGDIEALVREFEACTLPQAQWTHGAHLTVALWYLMNRSAQEATMSIRSGIRRYNEANGVRMTATGGYHETMTLFWTCAVSFYLGQAGEGRSILALANGMLSLFRNKHLPLAYYTRERLMSWRARTSWIEPDLKPLF